MQIDRHRTASTAKQPTISTFSKIKHPIISTHASKPFRKQLNSEECSFLIEIFYTEIGNQQRIAQFEINLRVLILTNKIEFSFGKILNLILNLVTV